MGNNFITKEVTQDDIDIVKEYTEKDKPHHDWFPLTTYDMIQNVYPTLNHQTMVSDSWGGTDEEGRLLTPTVMWCMIKDVKNYINYIISLVAGEKSK